MIENEVKYVLSLDCPELYGEKKKIIQQGYDNNGARLRKENNTYSFNYKMKVDDFIEEFEMDISKEEFERGYTHCVNKLTKTRYTVKDEYKNTWDIDFFYSGDKLYFAMAECEMADPTQEYPEKVIPIIEQYCIFRVPRTETRKFSSKKLSDVEYAKKMLETIKTS